MAVFAPLLALSVCLNQHCEIASPVNDRKPFVPSFYPRGCPILLIPREPVTS